MTTKIPVELSSTPSIVDNGDATAITISSGENVGIGASSPNYPLTIHNTGDGIKFEISDLVDANYRIQVSGNDILTGPSTASDLIFQTGNTERMRIDSSGNVGIGTTSPSSPLHIYSADNQPVRIESSDAYAGLEFKDSTSNASPPLISAQGDNLLFFQHDGTDYAERMRIHSSGNVLIGKNSLNNATIGTEIKFDGGLINVTNSSTQCMTMNRLTSDGVIVLFQQDTTSEGSISVSGSTVSYNGFSGNHESSGIASDTAIGTVCSTIDELDTYVSGIKEGQTRTDHPKIKVSDTQGDSRVYGVLSSYSEEDNKPIVASVGIGSVLVTGACEGGDLLESNGDGTAKVQDDDIIRSKTIGKVTIGNSNTDVKLVSCVLYCG